MKSIPGEWPSARWTLTAPESYLLLHGPTGSGADAFKLALLELVARGALALNNVEERRRFGGVKKTAVLMPGGRQIADLSRSLGSVLELFAGTPPRTFKDGTMGVSVADFARAAKNRYSSLDKYVEEEVLPTLSSRGLYVVEEHRTLGVFHSHKWVLTPAGEGAKDDLQAWIALGEREFTTWVEADPTRAREFLRVAGAAVLLMDKVYPNAGRPMRGRGQGAGSGVAPDYAPVIPGSYGDGGPERPESELDELDIEDFSGDIGDFSADFDLSVFGGLDSAFTDIGAGVDSGGGDGGGDGGGGNGGGE